MISKLACAFEVWRVWHKYEKGKAMQPEMDRALGLLGGRSSNRIPCIP